MRRKFGVYICIFFQMARDILGLQANRHHQKDGVKTEGVTKSKHAYGGEIYECMVNGKRHYVNVLQQGTMYDFTAEQFGCMKISYEDMRLRTRVSLLKSQSVKERYTLLKARLEEI